MNSQSQVAVIRTSPGRVIDDYARLLDLLDYQQGFPHDEEILLKLNLSWTRYYPACSTAPWQLDGILRKLIADGYSPSLIKAVENKTVVTDPLKGAEKNKWLPLFRKYGIEYIPLTHVKWSTYPFQSQLTILPEIFPEGIVIPRRYPGSRIIHLPTLKTHGHSTITGAIKNSFGGILKEVRHYCHKYIHETLLDLMIIQKELHPEVLAIMDGTVAGDGAGPRTMNPRITNYILGGFDQVAVDAVAAKIMGFDPLQINFIRLCHERGLGTGEIDKIEILGDDINGINLKFKTKKSFVIWGDQMLRKGFLKFMEGWALHSPLVFWAPMASNFYHDLIWYPWIGHKKIEKFFTTEWGRLYLKY
ncbi:DUF362 domain-containing protein [bacterium]|nr:DUF362 domain-containing protein [bacterium]